MRKNRGTIPERKRKKHREDSFAGRFRRGLSYLKDYRFSRILVRYFLLLFVCLVLRDGAVLLVWETAPGKYQAGDPAQKRGFPHTGL